MNTDDNSKETIRRREQLQKDAKMKEEEALESLRKQKRAHIKKKIKKRTRKSFWARYEDYFAYGLLAFLVGFIIYANFSGDRRKPSQIPVNEDVFIQTINDDNLSFTLKPTEFFEGQSIKDAKQLFSNMFTSENTQPRCDTKAIDAVEYPEKFNFYKKHPKCKSIQTQRQCSSSYVEAHMSLYKTRACSMGFGEKLNLSLDYLFNCDTKTGHNKGCKSGYLLNSLEYVSQNGYIDGECWNKLKVEEDTCPSKADLEKCKRYKISGYCVLQDEDEIKKEIFQNGPVLGLIQSYRELLTLEKGVFTFNNKNSLQGYQVIKVIGWGIDDGEDAIPYWLIENAWGETWAENGLAKIEMGAEDSFLDKFAVTLYPSKPL